MVTQEISTKAIAYFNGGYNCAQSVLMAYADFSAFDVKAAERLASGFGAGLAGLRGTCGAFSGLTMAYGLARGYDVSDPKDKADYYREIRRMEEEFVCRVGALDCKTLLQIGKIKAKKDPEPRTAEYYGKRPCAAFVKAACDILAEKLEGKG